MDLQDYLMNTLTLEFYNYEGSLTYPDCDEEVNWFVFSNRQEITQDQVDLFTAHIPSGNYRGSKTNMNDVLWYGLNVGESIDVTEGTLEDITGTETETETETTESTTDTETYATDQCDFLQISAAFAFIPILFIYLF